MPVVFADFQAHCITPAPRTTDWEFIRRVTLDLTGRIPTSDRVLTFVADTTPDKRAKLVEELIAKPEFEMLDTYGLKKLGIENCKPIFTRGHLFDIEALKGRMMEAGDEIKLADLRAAMQRQNMKEEDIKEGDAFFFNTGWGKLWMKNNDKFNSGEPGIGLEVAKWVIDKGAVMTGSDCWATEVVPNPDKNLAFPVHGELIAKNGIYNHENLDFTGLIADGKYQFAYIFSPAPIKGATGSNGGPIAVT